MSQFLSFYKSRKLDSRVEERWAHFYLPSSRSFLIGEQPTCVSLITKSTDYTLLRSLEAVREVRIRLQVSNFGYKII